MERIQNDRPWKVIWVHKVFSNVSFEIKEGDRLHLVGP